ncbi:hypothetical protein HMPREF9374_1699 [Desmospora sp. 8437]|nr:hypothetical protein HMPREF9374_1699 [Desmospora sp. 8437]
MPYDPWMIFQVGFHMKCLWITRTLAPECETQILTVQEHSKSQSFPRTYWKKK